MSKKRRPGSPANPDYDPPEVKVVEVAKADAKVKVEELRKRLEAAWVQMTQVPDVDEVALAESAMELMRANGDGPWSDWLEERVTIEHVEPAEPRRLCPCCKTGVIEEGVPNDYCDLCGILPQARHLTIGGAIFNNSELVLAIIRLLHAQHTLIRRDVEKMLEGTPWLD